MNSTQTEMHPCQILNMVADPCYCRRHMLELYDSPSDPKYTTYKYTSNDAVWSLASLLRSVDRMPQILGHMPYI